MLPRLLKFLDQRKRQKLVRTIAQEYEKLQREHDALGERVRAKLSQHGCRRTSGRILPAIAALAFVLTANAQTLIKDPLFTGTGGQLKASSTFTIKTGATVTAENGTTLNFANATVTLPNWVPVLDGGASRVDGDLFVWKESATKWVPKRLVAGTNVTISQSATAVTINATGGGGGGGGGGDMAHLARLTASSSSTLDFTGAISGSYDVYVVEFISVLPATNGANLQMVVSTDGGSTWEAGTGYFYDYFAWRAGGTGQSGSTNTSQFIIYPSVSSTASYGVSGRLTFYNPNSTTAFKTYTGKLRALDTAARAGFEVAGNWESTAAVNGLRFYFSSGAIASGIVDIYGLAH